jgi:hypothetical protein
MKILILWDGVKKRDIAQQYIYDYLSKNNEIFFSTPNTIFTDITMYNFDVLWLDIMHIRFNIDWNLLFSNFNKPIIFDQADNEEFVKEQELYSPMYKLIKLGVVCSRYLPNEKLQNFCKNNNLVLKQLSWYFKKDFFKNIKKQKKNIDVSYICSFETKERIKLKDKIENVCKNNNWNYVIGNYWGNDYYNLLSKSKIFVISSERNALTQKYFEASSLGCTIVGDIPLYPINNFSVYSITHYSLEDAIKTALNYPYVNKFEPTIEKELNDIFSIIK